MTVLSSSISVCYDWAIRSQFSRVRHLVRTGKNLWNRILAQFDNKLPNVYLEALKVLIQAASRRSRDIKPARIILSLNKDPHGPLPKSSSFQDR
ncbi:MAG: hypothetical protein BA870_06745 [Desulfuromonadales bacterium C00003094]|nr:MAG: hypothetical protein BA870_06745 [Desulfuromonadales bacterium C00003094]